MFCRNCGVEVAESAKFCPSCGAAVGQPQAAAGPAEAPAWQANTGASSGTQPVKKKKSKVGLILGAVVIVAVLFFFLKGGDPVDLVTGGKLDAYPEMTVGDAFAGFFSDPEWISYEQNGDTYVKFTGKCTLYGETVKAKVVFLIDDDDSDRFSIDSFKVGDINITSARDLETVLDKIYDE